MGLGSTVRRHQRVNQVLKYADPPPLFLGRYPLSYGVQCICAFHFCVCVFLISMASSVMPVSVGTFVISANMQVVVASYHVLGVLVIAGALVGLAQAHEYPLRHYFYYLCGTCAGIVALLLFMLSEGSQCHLVSKNLQTERIGMSFECGWVSATWFFVVFAGLSMAVYATWMVWHWKEYLWTRAQSAHLRGYEDPAITQHRAFGALDDPDAHSKFLDERYGEEVPSPFLHRMLEEDQEFNEAVQEYRDSLDPSSAMRPR